jgi:hypothetical protein
MDKRTGKHGGNEPKVCAVTLQSCNGRHASHYSIGGGYYITILEKAAKKMSVDDIRAVRDECAKLVSPQRKLKTTEKAKES